MGISIHVRGITKWGRRDCVTAHGLRKYCARTVSSSPRRRSPSVPVRMSRPGIRVVVGGTLIPWIHSHLFSDRGDLPQLYILTGGGGWKEGEGEVGEGHAGTCNAIGEELI